jgi:hypothetical protein
LVAQQEVLRDEIGAGAEGRVEEGDEQQQALDHQRHDRPRRIRLVGLDSRPAQP